MEYRLKPKYFDELTVGDKLITPSRTVTEADIVNFAGVSGIYNQVHTDEEFARSTGFATRIAHGTLILSVTIGLLSRLGLLDGNSLALLGLDSKFMRPVLPGDTISCLGEVINKRETHKPDRGVLTIKLQVFNQRQELVMETIYTTMHGLRPGKDTGTRS